MQNRSRPKDVIPAESTQEWLLSFALRYQKVKDHYYSISFGEGMALFMFLHAYMQCEFEDIRMEEVLSPVRELSDISVFRKTKPETVFRAVEDALEKAGINAIL